MGFALNLLKAPHIGVRELKTGLSAFLKREEALVVTDRGAPTNVILPYEDVLELLDILEELNDHDVRKAVAQGRLAIKSGAAGTPVFKVLPKKK